MINLTNKKLAVLLIAVLFLTLRLPALGYDISNTDAYRWHLRSENFLAALKHADLKATAQHYQPGVTLMWLNAVVKQFAFWTQYHVLKIPEPKTLENADWFPVIDGISRAAVVFVLLLLLLTQIFFVSKLVNFKSALIFGILIAVEPYLVGIDRWFHLTSLEAYFLLTALLALLYWSRNMSNKWLVLSASMYSLSVLSKITSLIALPTFLLIIFFAKRDILVSISKFLAAFSVCCLLVYPALMVSPLSTLSDIFAAVFGAVSDNYRNDQLTTFTRLFFYDLVLLLKLSPLTLILLFAAIFNFRKLSSNLLVKVVAANLCLYYIVLALAQQKIDRYVVVLIPQILLFISVFLSTQSLKLQKTAVSLALAFIVFVSYLYFPVYSAYYSPIFGGTRGAIKLGVYDNSGEYFAQAAFYLNSKGRDTQVYVPNGIASFMYYYKGVSQRNFNETTDFIVHSLDLTRPNIKEDKCPYLDKSFGSKEKQIVFVYRCH